MSLLIKKILQKIKEFENKTKVETLTISNLLQNNWKTNGQNSIFKTNNIVYINLALRYGTDKIAMILPEGYRPSASLMQQLVGANGNIGYVLIANNGQVSFERITTDGGSETFMTSFTFPVN